MVRFRPCIWNTLLVMMILTSARAQVGTSTPTAVSSDQSEPYENRVVASFPRYAPQQQVSGVIRISGHGSTGNPWMRQLLTAWEKDFQRFQPGIRLEYRMYGTSSAIPALFNGVADIAILGEEIDPVAVRTFERVKHYPPTGGGRLHGQRGHSEHRLCADVLREQGQSAGEVVAD